MRETRRRLLLVYLIGAVGILLVPLVFRLGALVWVVFGLGLVVLVVSASYRSRYVNENESAFLSRAVERAPVWVSAAYWAGVLATLSGGFYLVIAYLLPND